MANPRQNRAEKNSAAAREQKLQDKLDKLQSRYDNAKELLEKPGGMDTSRMKGANRLLSQIDEVKQQLKDLRGYVSAPTPKNRPASKYRGEVKPAPGSNLEDKGPARSTPPVPENRPSPVDTKSKKSIIERLMMELRGEIGRPELTRKRMEENREDAMETMGRKKGGMAKKKKAPVKKAYGGMVKKKQGGSANKVNMKAGFTRRGCSKG